MKLAVETYIETHPDWFKELGEKPFLLRVKENPAIPGEFLFSYNLIESDFFNDVVKDCRGLLLQVSEKRETRRVCYAFRKFANYGEGYADAIDWKTAVVRDKVDGSLIKRFYRGEKRCWATNNGFNAEADLPNELPIDGDEGLYKSFQDVINVALENEPPAEDQKDWTIMFELTSPYNQIVINYGPKPKLWLLGARNNITCQEITPEEAKKKWNLPYDTPALYPLQNIEDCLRAAAALGNDREGFVVQDGFFRRVKVKGAAYLAMHHLKDESGNLSLKHVYRCIQEGIIDDVLAAFPEYSKTIQSLIDRYNALKAAARNALAFMGCVRENIAKENLDPREARKRYALTVTGDEKLQVFSSLLFNALRDGQGDITEAWMKDLSFDDFNERLVSLGLKT